MGELAALKQSIADVRGRIDAMVTSADAAVLADAAKQDKTRVARDSFKSVANNLRRALSHIDELSADLERAQRDHELSKMEK